MLDEDNLSVASPLSCGVTKDVSTTVDFNEGSCTEMLSPSSGAATTCGGTSKNSSDSYLLTTRSFI